VVEVGVEADAAWRATRAAQAAARQPRQCLQQSIVKSQNQLSAAVPRITCAAGVARRGQRRRPQVWRHAVCVAACDNGCVGAVKCHREWRLPTAHARRAKYVTVVAAFYCYRQYAVVASGHVVRAARVAVSLHAARPRRVCRRGVAGGMRAGGARQVARGARASAGAGWYVAQRVRAGQRRREMQR